LLLKNDRRKRKTEATAETLIGHLHAHYYERYAMIVFSSDIAELHPDPK
jgi:hypothetical protein